jgi:glycosyltransferase involved in cell wall biosynthesis
VDREGWLANAPRSVCIVERGANPSSDYYVRARLAALGVPSVALPEDGTLVVIVRYLDSAWRERIEAIRNRLAGIVYFMDDDLLDLGAVRRAPLRYAARMAWLAWRHRSWLQRVGAKMWVSTPYLAHKYQDWSPELVEPTTAWPGIIQRRAPVRVFYHGTGLHRDEIRWLAPVMRAVQAGNDATSFEIFGRAWVERLYRDVPRSAVLHPSSWENFRDYCAGRTLDIGLAPLLPHRFNAARSHTKFFDFVRCGAAGIYSNIEPYASFVRHERDGLLVDNDPAAWAQAILRLAGDAELRSRLAAEAQRRAMAG